MTQKQFIKTALNVYLPGFNTSGQDPKTFTADTTFESVVTKKNVQSLLKNQLIAFFADNNQKVVKWPGDWQKKTVSELSESLIPSKS